METILSLKIVLQPDRLRLTPLLSLPVPTIHSVSAWRVRLVLLKLAELAVEEKHGPRRDPAMSEV